MTRLKRITLSLAIPAIVAGLISPQLMCRDPDERPSNAQKSDATPDPASTVTATAATTLPAGPTSVRVSIMMVVQRRYGRVARLSGKKDVTTTDKEYSADRSWWDNPMVIYQDAAFPSSDVTAKADSAEITGSGRSANVSVDLTLVPRADVTLESLVKSDCMKGTLTATITTINDYYDRKWTRVAEAQDTPIAFDFDTSDKSKTLRPTTTESRTMPPFSFERYTRGRQKWEPRSAWPTKPKSGDLRCTIHVTDAKLVMTGYQYDQPKPTEPAATQPTAAGLDDSAN